MARREPTPNETLVKRLTSEIPVLANHGLWKEAADRIEDLEKSERAVRVHLWINHGCTGVYGDDGEMQCNNINRHGKPLDFVRMPIEELLEADRQCASPPSYDKLIDWAADLREVNAYLTTATNNLARAEKKAADLKNQIHEAASRKVETTK